MIEFREFHKTLMLKNVDIQLAIFIYIRAQPSIFLSASALRYHLYLHMSHLFLNLLHNLLIQPRYVFIKIRLITTVVQQIPDLKTKCRLSVNVMSLM